MTTNKPLRLAPIIRVSTEKQEKQGESLNTQTEQILGYINALEAEIPEECWKYSGQEHASPQMERNKLNQLLVDTSKGIFDAVIVCDASRWSRDNFKSKEGLEVLRQNGIRFFVGTTEFDLEKGHPKRSGLLYISVLWKILRLTGGPTKIHGHCPSAMRFDFLHRSMNLFKLLHIVLKCHQQSFSMLRRKDHP